jgi:hypothetical protein
MNPAVVFSVWANAKPAKLNKKIGNFRKRRIIFSF